MFFLFGIQPSALLQIFIFSLTTFINCFTLKWLGDQERIFNINGIFHLFNKEKPTIKKIGCKILKPSVESPF